MKNKILIIIVLVIFSSCGDILEKDIKDCEIEIYSPGNIAVVKEKQKIKFSWEEDLNATKYLLQISKPSFKDPNEIILDTIIDKSPLYYMLKEGEYTWRIQARNNYSCGKFKSKSLVVKKDEVK